MKYRGEFNTTTHTSYEQYLRHNIRIFCQLFTTVLQLIKTISWSLSQFVLTTGRNT